MKPKINDEEKKEMLRRCITKLDRCIYLLDEAYEAHLIADQENKNMSVPGHSGPALD